MSPPDTPDGLGLQGLDADSTRSRILAAAFRRLAADGYGALSVREIAKDAGVNHALINYYFRSKDQLVIEVLDTANRRLLARQNAMYAMPVGFAQKWAQACRFYEEDIASGFVRVQAELWAASMANAELRAKFLPRVLAWKKLVRDNVGAALQALEEAGVVLPPPFDADVIACWISEFWLGMEFADLLEVGREKAQHRAALAAVETLLRSLDRRAAEGASRSPPASTRKSTSRRR